MGKTILVGLCTDNESQIDNSMEELASLAEACDMEVAGTMVQTLSHPVSATYIGQGKAEEISYMVSNMEVEYVIFEDTLTPTQHKNLSKIIKAEVMDRTGLILEIFSRRAQTREAKLQVETAQLQYMLPRLIGMWEAIGRQGGTSGSKSSKGVGETQLELDRRWIQRRLTQLRRELETIEHDRNVQRARREKSRYPLVSLVGYTNAGKSTLMNRLLSLYGDEDKQVLEKDMLFATLDTSVRKIDMPDKKSFLLSDTVGFVDKLPHSLVKAFRSTLDEIKYADLLIEVVDYSDERCLEHMRVTNETLRELGANEIPIIHVMNKADLCPSELKFPRVSGDKIYMSASSMVGMDELLEMIKERIYSGNKVVSLLLPYDKGALVNEINNDGNVIKSEYREDGVYIEADLTPLLLGRCREYVVGDI